MAETQTANIHEVEAVFRDGLPGADVQAKRHGWSIRVRITDPRFVGLSRIQREAIVFPLLERLKPEVASDITMLLLRAPGDEKGILDMEFDDPTSPAI